ncbi:PREDICTED: leucine-rich repeat-containing protein 24-like [Branchiostoma belcheri]|uniref:Leucine-rich repeat-containing protein 24-like n=1 Tax=Branchiostoma belcheri TaxID=7741 RepID=A0A6P5ADG5_BRABE|nr:PREDICTED: leucine-rich repeat-containing protein 24-like [Branchiostoma belcheri]
MVQQASRMTRLFPLLLCSTLLSLPTALCCPEGCECLVSLVNCQAAGLSSMPTDLPVDTDHLDFTENNLTYIYAVTFKQLPQVQQLYLAGNKIAGIEFRALSMLKHLKILDLRHNRLTELREYYFTGLSKLRQLFLVGNNITRVDTMAFSGLFRIEKIYLGKNRLTTFPWTSLFLLPMLEQLDLTENRIQILDPKIQNMPQADAFFLHDNPYKCNCQMRWFGGWLNSGVVPQGMDAYRHLYKCYLPESLRLHKIASLKQEDFYCAPPVLTVYSRMVVVENGMPASLCCHMTSGSPTDVQWLTAHNITISGNTSVGRIRAQGNCLHIKSVIDMDVGEYVCTVTNRGGTVMASLSLGIGQPRTEQYNINANKTREEEEMSVTIDRTELFILCGFSSGSLVFVAMYLFIKWPNVGPCKSNMAPHHPPAMAALVASSSITGNAVVLADTKPGHKQGGTDGGVNKKVKIVEPGERACGQMVPSKEKIRSTSLV